MKESFADIFNKLDSDDAYPITSPVGSFIYYFIKAEKPKIIVELGSGQGIGTYWIASAMPDDAILYSIEENNDWLDKARVRCKKFGDRIRFYHCPLNDDGWYTIPEIVPQSVDLLIIDGPMNDFKRPIAHEYFDAKYCLIDDATRNKSFLPPDCIVLRIDGGIGYLGQS